MRGILLRSDGLTMAKNSKKNRFKSSGRATGTRHGYGSTALSPSGDNCVGAVLSVSHEDSPSHGAASFASAASNQERQLTLKTLIGTVDEEVFEHLLEPVMAQFALTGDESGLRMQAESLVSSIAMRDDFARFRKLDDICQRYLYYLESASETNKRTREFVEIQGLCTYWRSQMCMAMVRDSAHVGELLLSSGAGAREEHSACASENGVNEVLAPTSLSQALFLAGVSTAFDASVGAIRCTRRDDASFRELYDFAHGMSFPWLGFEPDRIFNLQHLVFDEALCVDHSFAHLSFEQAAAFEPVMRACLENVLFIDLVYAQHRKLYDELAQVYQPEERLTCDALEALRKRVRFDKVYQSAFDSVLRGVALKSRLHRSSRLDIDALNAFGVLAKAISHAVSSHSGVYLFHYFG